MEKSGLILPIHFSDRYYPLRFAYALAGPQCSISTDAAYLEVIARTGRENAAARDALAKGYVPFAAGRANTG